MFSLGYVPVYSSSGLTKAGLFLLYGDTAPFFRETDIHRDCGRACL